MKILKKLTIVFAFIFCSCFLFACGGEKKTELDYSVNVNTSGNYSNINDKTELTQYTSPTSEDYIAKNTGVKLTMTFNTGTQEGSSMSMNANAIFLYNNQVLTEMGIKINLSIKTEIDGSTINPNIIGTMYKPNSNYYVSTTFLGTRENYFFTEQDVTNGDVVISDFNNVQDFDFTQAIEEINKLAKNEKSIISKSVENTTTKYKVVLPALSEEEHTNTAVLILENNVFAGLYYSLEINDLVTNVNLVPYSGNIEYPSFDDYKHISQI